jgi:glycosyltransferase involved in cell wall biosynthesis
LIKAYEEILITGEIAFDLVIAGPGEETHYGNKLKKQVAASKLLKDRVHFTGMLHGAAKWGAIYHSEAFILPSHQENFGIAVVEAMACKKPVLISNKVNIWREILDGNGGIVENDDLEGTRSLLDQWIQLSATEKKEMGENAYTVYQNCFTAQVTSQKFVQILLSASE